jgi:hypothetical protein
MAISCSGCFAYFSFAGGKRLPLLGFPASTAGGANVVEGDGTAAEEDECEGNGGQSQGKLVSAIAHQSVMEVHLGDGDGQIDTDGKSSHASEQADQNEQAAEEFGEGGKICAPGGKSEAGNELNMVLEAAEDLVVSVVDDDGAKNEAHNEEREGLQAIEVAQVVPPAKKKGQLTAARGGREADLRPGPAARKKLSRPARQDSTFGFAQGRAWGLSPH